MSVRQLEIARAYRRLFLNDDGSVKPDADTVLRDLEKLCGWMNVELPVDSQGRADPLRTAAAVEKRGVYATVKQRLFGPLTKLIEQEQKNG